MKKLLNPRTKNSGAIGIDLSPEDYTKLMQRTFKALQKFSSSRKTKAVHKLLSSSVVTPALFSGNASDYLIAAGIKGNTLRELLFNLKMFDDSLSQNGAVGYASQLIRIDEKIRKEKTYISEKQIYNIEQLEKNRDETVEKFLNSIDYIKLIDGIYFGWLTTLSASVIEREGGTKPKIVTYASDILAKILKKMYSKVNVGKKMESEVHQLIEAIAIYFIRIYYYGETAQYALNLMKKGISEDILEVIRRARVTKFKEFNELSTVLNQTQLMPLTTTAFDLEMQRMFGKYAYEFYIQTSFMDFITFMANLAHPTLLFKEAYEIDDESHKRLEELLLNEQKSIKIAKKEI